MTMTQKKKRKSQGLMTAIALGSLFAAFGASPANAAEVSPMSSEQVTLTDSQASALLLEADLPDQAASTYVLDPTDVEGWSIPGVVIRTLTRFPLALPHRLVTSAGTSTSTLRARSLLALWSQQREVWLRSLADQSEASSPLREVSRLGWVSCTSGSSLSGAYDRIRLEN